jgi:hypothetical protein
VPATCCPAQTPRKRRYILPGKLQGRCEGCSRKNRRAGMNSEVVASWITAENITSGLKRRPVPQMVHGIVLSLCCDVHECRNSITEMEKQTFGPICRVLHSEACRTTTISPIFPRKYQHPPSKKTFLTPPSPLRQHFHRSS